VLVAHFSDLHLLSLESARPRDFLNKRVTGGANLLFNRGGQFPVAVARALCADVWRQGIEHVILSGDLTNLAFPAELKLVRSVLEELGLPPAEVTVVPGNHDAYTRQAAASGQFARLLGPYLQGDRQAWPGTFPFLRLRGELAVLALSTAVPSLPLLAVGRLGEKQLRTAESYLGDEACRGRFRLVVLHHPPVGPLVHWHNRLVDAKAFRAMIQRAGADLVVHGHLHRFCEETLAGPSGPIPCIGVGSGTWLSPHDPERRAQYNLYRIEGGRLTAVLRRRYDPASESFAALP